MQRLRYTSDNSNAIGVIEINGSMIHNTGTLNEKKFNYTTRKKIFRIHKNNNNNNYT